MARFLLCSETTFSNQIFLRRGEMTKDTFETVVASYDRCQEAGDFFESFYTRFLQKSPELPGMFAKTDFTRQRRMLKQSLFEMMIYYRGIEDSADDEIDKLAVRHREMNVTQRHYNLWLESLIQTILEFDSQANEKVIAAWQAAMEPGLTAMRAKAADTNKSETQ